MVLLCGEGRKWSPRGGGKHRDRLILSVLVTANTAPRFAGLPGPGVANFISQSFLLLFPLNPTPSADPGVLRPLGWSMTWRLGQPFPFSTLTFPPLTARVNTREQRGPASCHPHPNRTVVVASGSLPSPQLPPCLSFCLPLTVTSTNTRFSSQCPLHRQGD